MTAVANGPKEFHAFLDAETFTVVAYSPGGGEWYPLVKADGPPSSLMFGIAQRVANETKRAVLLVRYTQPELIQQMDPTT